MATEREVLDAMADTLRAIIVAVDQPKPYPWWAGALKHQIREDLTAYDLLELDVPITDKENHGA